MPDWKPPKRIRDASLMRRIHLRGGVICVLCGNRGTLHHVYPRGQGGDDVERNLIGLCGDGVTGHHGLIEDGDVAARIELGDYILGERRDIIGYMQDKLGSERGLEWLRQRLFMSV